MLFTTGWQYNFKVVFQDGISFTDESELRNKETNLAGVQQKRNINPFDCSTPSGLDVR